MHQRRQALDGIMLLGTRGKCCRQHIDFLQQLRQARLCVRQQLIGNILELQGGKRLALGRIHYRNLILRAHRGKRRHQPVDRVFQDLARFANFMVGRIDLGKQSRRQFMVRKQRGV